MPARATLAQRIVRCERCPRLREHCQEIARLKRRAYLDEEYWGRPVPPFGAAQPALLVVGLAPGAHGANRTGRVFTGDASGDWLYRALHQYQFANQPTSTATDDGLELRDAAVTCAARCAPPGNRPTAAELANCRPYLVEELQGYRRLRVVLALGGIAYDAIRRGWPQAGHAPFPQARFAHGAEAVGEAGVTLIASYHPSRQNTNTGRLTRRMFHRCFRRARELVDGKNDA